MRSFFDTSALVPVFYGDHVHHAASIARFIQFDKASGCCAAHSLVEVYSTLTRMPGKHRISSEQAMLFIDSIRERLSAVALDGEECADALKAAASLGIVGGGIYDAMIAHCALKAKADVIYSWNTRHYSLLGAAVTELLRTPSTTDGCLKRCPRIRTFPTQRKPGIETTSVVTCGAIARSAGRPSRSETEHNSVSNRDEQYRLGKELPAEGYGDSVGNVTEDTNENFWMKWESFA